LSIIASQMPLDLRTSSTAENRALQGSGRIDILIPCLPTEIPAFQSTRYNEIEGTPLGCYEVARYNGDAKAMVAKVLSIYQPQEFAVPSGHNVPAAGGLSATASNQAQ
jgi:hypothetical protein